MPQQPGQFPTIDGFKFAATGGELHGSWPVRVFPRLRDLLHDDSGAIAYEVRGGTSAHGRPQLALRAWGTLRLTCRRCLEALEFPVRVDTALLLAPTQADVDATVGYLEKQGVAALFETPRHRPDFATSETDTYYQVMFESPDGVLSEVVYTGPKG